MTFDSTDRDLFRRIWRMTWPMVVYNLLEMTVGLVDFLMVRPLGSPATAAIGLSRQVTFIIEVAVLAISTGAITLVSQAVGSGERGRAAEVVRQSFRLAVLFAVPTSLLGIAITRPMLTGMNAAPETLAHGVGYLHVYFAGIVFLWGNLVGTAVFRGAGNPWTPLKLALGVNLANVVLNYVFIFGAGPVPAFEVQGAAIGTVIARAGGALACLGLLMAGASGIRLRATNSDGDGQPVGWWSWNWVLTGRILRIGAPMALAGLLRGGSRLVFLAIIGAGATGVLFHAAVGVGIQLRLIACLPALAFQAAAASLVGQAIGRGDYDEAEALGRRSVLMLATIMAVVSGVMLVFAGPLAALFLDSPETVELGTTVLRWFAVAQFFSALSIATQGALVGAGDTAPAMRYTFFCQWVVMLPLAYLLVVVAGWALHGPLAAWTLAPMISLLLIWRRLQSGRWKQVPV